MGFFPSNKSGDCVIVLLTNSLWQVLCAMARGGWATPPSSIPVSLASRAGFPRSVVSAAAPEVVPMAVALITLCQAYHLSHTGLWVRGRAASSEPRPGSAGLT